MKSKTAGGQKKAPMGKLYRGIVVYFIAILVPLIVISLVSYESFWRKNQQDLSARIHLSLTGAVKNADHDIDIVQNACMSFFYDPRVRQHLRPIAASSEADRLEQIYIHRHISTLTNLTGTIADAMFVYLDDKHVFSDGLYSFDDYFGKLYVYEGYDSDFWASLLSKTGFLSTLPATNVTRYPQTVRRVVPLVYSTRIAAYDMVAVMPLSVQCLVNNLRSALITADTGIVVLDSENRIIHSDFPAESTTADQLGPADRDYAPLTFMNREYMAVYAFSENTGWRYQLLVPMEQITALSDDFLTLLILLLCAFFLASCLALYFARRISSPIGRMYSALEEDQEGLPSLEEISRRVTFVLSDYQEAREEQESMQSNYIELMALQLLSGRKLDQGEKLTRLLKREHSFDNPCYQCVVMRISFDWMGETPLQDTERLNLQVNLKADLTEYLSQRMPCYVLEHRDNEYVCIMNPEREADSLIEDLFTRLLESFRRTGRVASAHIVVGTGVAKVSEIGKAYFQASQTLASLPADDPWIIAGAEHGGQGMEVLYPLKAEMRLMSALRSGDRERAFEIIEGLLRENTNAGHYKMSLLIHDLFVTGMRFLAERDETLENRQMYQGLRREIELPGGMEEKERLLCALYEELLSMKTSTGDSNLTANITRYVQENYASDLYLESIAQEMGLTVKYISRVFKAKTGQNLSDYINHVRMEHVKDMLLNTDMSISAISEAVGIYSRTTFLRIFRKYEGVTPSEYRELSRDDREC